MKTEGGVLFRTDFDKIACDNLIKNYAFESAFPKDYFKNIVITPFFGRVEESTKILRKKSKMRKVYGLTKDSELLLLSLVRVC